MNKNLYSLFLEHQEKIASTRGIKISGLVDAHEINKVESRATFLTLLDARLFEHRKNTLPLLITFLESSGLNT
ncbi:hypothetical protein RQL91_09345 [Citrobacter freundii]|uniref:hypothetical protein n=1 Tax=Citrobacter freundii TaxID=546 RepID=UPI0028BD2BE0|nr:hypothetical protein [Citrobacter freundii]MDT7349339.1 hypothetical protein [Citrobacter freundii]